MLAFSHMGYIAPEGHGKEIVPGEATSFDAETHVAFFRETFDAFDINFDDWCVFILAGNGRVNNRIATLVSKPQVSCMSHRLNFEINIIVLNSPQVNKTIQQIHEVMRYVKTHTKNRKAKKTHTHENRTTQLDTVARKSWGT